MHHLNPGITRHQRENLRILARYLERGSFSHGFDMIDFAGSRHDDYRLETPHGFLTEFPAWLRPDVRLCAIGCSPLTDIPHREDDSWQGYAVRELYNTFVDTEPTAYSWIFSRSWRTADNTPQGAAARIRHLLKHGIPANCQHQQLGWHPLCYPQDPPPASPPPPDNTSQAMP